MELTITSALFLPLISAIILLFFSSWLGRRLTGIIACTSIALAFLCFIYIVLSYLQTDLEFESFTEFNWIDMNGLKASFTLHVDALSLLMGLIITGVGSLIHIYSIGYIDHEEDFGRYFACMNFFVFSMLLLVLAGNLLLLFVGWEGVGLASYLLIGYYYHRPTAAKAATKAFVVNRIGDAGFLAGILLTFVLFGTTDIVQISQNAKAQFAVGAPIITLLTLLYFWGAVGKSAQLPLHVWLPDAMEGPTPVSALIHAATMVTAGVYLVVRLDDIFMLAPLTMQVIGVIGAATALFASLCAVAQMDLKRVLAYSTVSQLGLMFLACGIGAYYAAMFHLLTHAFVKALLFLSAGNVVHMMSGTTNMEMMGSLSSRFPKTHWLFLIGVLALSGIPPFSAYFSKDLILEQEYLAGYNTLFWVALIASMLTGFYLTRAYCLTFWGKSKLEPKIFKAIHEAPPVMLIPVTILAVLSIAGGLIGAAIGHESILEYFLGRVDLDIPYEETSKAWIPIEGWYAIIGAFLGVGSSFLIYTYYSDRMGRPLTLLRRTFFIDEIYDFFIVRPFQALSRFVLGFVEPKLFDGSISMVTTTAQSAAGVLQRVQSGQIRSYVAWMLCGLAFLVIYLLF